MNDEKKQLTCLQIHNDYQIPGGETKTALLIADLLERHGIRVIRYYKTNKEYDGRINLINKIKHGTNSIYNKKTVKEINEIIKGNNVDFALVHNVVSVISNSAYKLLIRKKIPIIKYLQNYNLFCLNGALDHNEKCEACYYNNLVGVKCKCYKGSAIYSLIKYIIKKDMDKRILSHISAFMPNSKFVANKHVERGISTRKMYVMHNYVNISQIEYDRNRDFYLYFGRLSNEKGVMTTITSFSKVPDVKLKIMGTGALEENIKNRIINEHLSNVEFIGSREGKELLEIVAKAKAVIVPSEWDEPLPRTILEAYSQGTPVIGSNRGGIPELIRNEQTGYIFEAGNSYEMIRTIEKMERLTEVEYLNMRKNCVDYLNEEYTEEAYFNRFLRCLREII